MKFLSLLWRDLYVISLHIHMRMNVFHVVWIKSKSLENCKRRKIPYKSVCTVQASLWSTITYSWVKNVPLDCIITVNFKNLSLCQIFFTNVINIACLFKPLHLLFSCVHFALVLFTLSTRNIVFYLPCIKLGTRKNNVGYFRKSYCFIKNAFLKGTTNHNYKKQSIKFSTE